MADCQMLQNQKDILTGEVENLNTQIDANLVTLDADFAVAAAADLANPGPAAGDTTAQLSARISTLNRILGLYQTCLTISQQTDNLRTQVTAAQSQLQFVIQQMQAAGC